MPVQTVTPTSPVAGSMLTVAGTIAGSNGAAPDGTLTVTVSSPFSSLSVGFAQLLQEKYVWEPIECVVYPSISMLGGCGSLL